MATFTVFDDKRVHADSLDAAATHIQPSTVELYLRAFERLARNAVYGAQVRSLITAAIGALP